MNKIKLVFLRSLIRFILKFHNFFYGLAGLLSAKLEPDNIHPKHRILDYHQWFVSQLKPEWRVLDVGCGNGALTADLAKVCAHAVGIDISSPNIEQAKKKATAEFICGDATTYPFEGEFDAVVLSNVLEHIEDRVNFLKKLKKITKRFLIRVPMIDRDWITLYKRQMGVEYRLDKTHVIEYTFDGLVNELGEAGLGIDSYRIRYGEIYAVVKE